MSVNVKLGNDTIENINAVQLQSADNPDEYITFDADSVKLNIEYSQIPPTDTSKLWIKADAPGNLKISPEVLSGDIKINSNIGSVPIKAEYYGAQVGDYVYIFAETTIYKYDLSTNAYIKLDVSLPETRTDACVVGTDIYIYIWERYLSYFISL